MIGWFVFNLARKTTLRLAWCTLISLDRQGALPWDSLSLIAPANYPIASQEGKLDPTIVKTHELPLEQAPEAYKMFDEKTDEVVKVVLKPALKGE